MDKNPVPDYWYKIFLLAVKKLEKGIPAEQAYWMAKAQFDATLPQVSMNLNSESRNGQPVAGDAGQGA